MRDGFLKIALCAAACLCSAPPASGRVSDARWKQLQRQSNALWATRKFAKRRQALGLLGQADREESARGLLALLDDIAIAAPEQRKQYGTLRQEFDGKMAERDRLYKLKRSGNRNWTEQEHEQYDRLIRRFKRLNRDLGRLEKALTEADILRHDVIEALAASNDGRARAALYADGLASKHPHVRGAAVQALWQAREKDCLSSIRALFTDPDPGVASMALRAFGAIAPSADEQSGKRLIAQLQHRDWRVRDGAITALGQLRHRPAVGALVEALERERGRLTGDLHQALSRITGFPFGNSPDSWKQWYSANKHRLDQVIQQKKTALKSGHSFGTVSFYGIQTSSHRICFVIDVSGSMKEKAGAIDPRIAGVDRRYPRSGSKLQVARYELQKAIDQLSDAARFNIVYFNGTVRIYRENGMLTASKKDKAQVTNWLRYRIRALGGTRMFDALARGLSEDADTIYFLTDGTPTSGYLTDPADILREITSRNQQRNMHIHVIAVGQQVDGNFLRQLAVRNRGSFVHTNK